MKLELKPCPFCWKAMLLRGALWPSEGDRDAIIHAVPTDCPLPQFSNDTFDGSIVEVWNRRAINSAMPPDVARLVDAAIRSADYISERLVAGKRPTISDTEDLRNHVRKLATALRLSAASLTGGWRPMESAPKDGTEFQAWTNAWEPRCRFNPETGAFEIWGRVDYDMDGWDTYPHLIPTHWQHLPASPTVEAGHVE